MASPAKTVVQTVLTVITFPDEIKTSPYLI